MVEQGGSLLPRNTARRPPTRGSYVTLLDGLPAYCRHEQNGYLNRQRAEHVAKRYPSAKADVTHQLWRPWGIGSCRSRHAPKPNGAGHFHSEALGVRGDTNPNRSVEL